MSVHFPGIGELTRCDDGWLRSQPVPVRMFGGQLCAFEFDDYKSDDAKDDFHDAVAALLSGGEVVLREADEHLYRYYKDYEVYYLEQGREAVASSANIWNHVQFGKTVSVRRRSSDDTSVYMLIECECDWEPEHGLQIVLKQGAKVTMLGPFEGHLSNADAWGIPALEQVVYVWDGMVT